MKQLRRYIRTVLLEDFSLSDMLDFRESNLKFDEDLMILNDPKDSKVFILADATYVQDKNTWDPEYFSDFVLGMVHLTTMLDEPCHGAKAVRRGAAVDGYGPTLYDAVMEITPEPIINDRDSVSNEMINMMDFYLKKRGDDVQKQLLDNVDDGEYGPPNKQKRHRGKTPDPNDDCTPGDFGKYSGGVKKGSFMQSWEDDPLSYAYNKDLSPRVKEMLEKGNKFMEKFGLHYWDLRPIASDFFTSRFT